MSEQTNERQAEIEALLLCIRDVPVTDDPEGPTVQVPVELAGAIAAHLWHCGVRQMRPPDRRWTQPRHGPMHTMNPGAWRPVGPAGEEETGDVT